LSAATKFRSSTITYDIMKMNATHAKMPGMRSKSDPRNTSRP
jgi:hypothetical protein